MTSDYIERLHLKNFRQFKLLNVEFNKKFNFIAGPNGCGKTSILAGISHCFNADAFQYSRFQDDSEVWTDLTVSGEKSRIGIGKSSIENKGYRNQLIKGWLDPDEEVGRKLAAPYEAKEKSFGFYPLFIGAQRSFEYQQISGMKREPARDQKLREHASSGTHSLYGGKPSNIKQWFINRYFMIDKDWAHEERVNWEHMISSLSSLAPFNSNFSYIRTGKDLEPTFSIYGEDCYMEELSAGFQAVLSIVASVVEWIEGTRENGNRLAVEAPGTVLIDELDLHLHPEWQFSLRDGLSDLFPNIQFIVTTHSPHLLSSAKEGEVIIMDRNYEENKFNLKPSEKKYSGWNTDQILSEVMGVVSLDNKDYEKLISEAFDKVEQNSIDGLKDSIQRFTEICHPNDSVLPF